MSLIPAIVLSRILQTILRILKIGGGSAAPGLLALKIDTELISKLSSQIKTNIVITGTNGKTTTARLLSSFSKSKYNVIRNSTGSNLARGIASALIEKASIKGKIRGVNLGIWELDEAAFNKTVFEIKPQIIVFLNAFRDQLDRYGEVDKVAKNWWDTLSKIDWSPTILVNGGDINTWNLASVTEMNQNIGKIFEFRVKNHFLLQEKSLKVNSKLHKDDFNAVITKDLGLEGTQIKVTYPKGSMKLSLPIPGIYHIYDLLAAFGVHYILDPEISRKLIQENLDNFKPAFGRVEKLSISGVESYIFLIKNPAGATAVFETVVPQIKKEDKILISLNDNFADGTDVSWIWDAEFERVKGKGLRVNVICSGTRAYDLAVRLKYAGVDPKLLTVIPDIETALLEGVSKKEGRLFILPTYTALLQLQQILVKKGIKSHYWKEVE